MLRLDNRAWCWLVVALLTIGVLYFWVDAAVIHFVHDSFSASSHEFFGEASELANANGISVLTLATFGASSYALRQPVSPAWKIRWEKAKQTSLLLILTLISGGLVTLALKHLVARARPSELLDHGVYGLGPIMEGEPFNSFPSSHAFTAFAAAFVLAAMFPKWRKPLVILAVLTASCRILTLEHFPSDVLASAVIAAACVWCFKPYVQNKKSVPLPTAGIVVPEPSDNTGA